MTIDEREVRRIAALARLEIPADRIDRTARELSAVLEFAATLRSLDLAGCEPRGLAGGGSALREDVVDEERRLTAEVAVSAAPESEGPFFLVPPIVENVNP